MDYPFRVAVTNAVLNTWYVVINTWYAVLNTCYLVLNTCYVVLNTWYVVLNTWCAVLNTDPFGNRRCLCLSFVYQSPPLQTPGMEIVMMILRNIDIGHHGFKAIRI